MKDNAKLQLDVQNAIRYYQKEEAGRIAWNTPGIWHVKNELAVDYYYAFVG